jgi:phytanoyl-CoA dioxygenase PhyH
MLYRERLEARVPDIKKMKTKSHLLCPWVLEIAEDPHTLDIFEDLIGPNIRCWSMAWRVKKADGETFAGWHQDSAYGAALPMVLGGLALSECGVAQGCLRGIPGSHRGGNSRARRERRPPEHPLQGAVHHRSRRRVQGGGLRAAARRDGAVRFVPEPWTSELSPDAGWSEAALANWSAVVNRRAQLIFADSKVGPSEAYGGTCPAT